MKKLLSNYYTKWYIPVLVSVLVCLLGIFFLGIRSEAAFCFALGLPFATVIISGVLGIIKLFKKQYLHGILQIVATVTIAIAGIMFIAFYLFLYPYDYYADNLEIPSNIKIEIPQDSINITFDKHTDFKLYNGEQPGIYTYDISISSPKKGTIFLKAFEITQNDPLSVQSLKSETAISVTASDKPTYHRLEDDFTISEGDWDRPYAARFEMWFKDSETGKETKLTKKNYKIEGWMR